MPVVHIWFIWLTLISLLSVIATISDKTKARQGAWRVPENTLILLSVLGGSAAMFLTMLLIRHKTRHIKFMLGIPLILVFQLILVLYLRNTLGY